MRSQASTVLVARYGGVVDQLARLLAEGGIEVAMTWAADRADGVVPGAHDTAGRVLVVTAVPADPTLDALLVNGAVAAARRLVVVTWHPADELRLPGHAVVVPTGSLSTGLVAAVRG